MEIKQLAEDMMSKMKSIIEEGKEAMPLMFVVDDDDTINIIGLEMGQDNKNQIAALMKLLLAMPRTKHLLFLSDTYMRSTENDKEADQLFDKYKEVRLMPGRIEAIICTVMTPGNKTLSASWKYERDPNNKPIFKELRWLEEGKVTGRFAPQV